MWISLRNYAFEFSKTKLEHKTLVLPLLEISKLLQNQVISQIKLPTSDFTGLYKLRQEVQYMEPLKTQIRFNGAI